jgi:multiple sugar transport system permease protein
MIPWVDTPVVITRIVLLVLAASYVMAWFARRRKRDWLTWFAAGVVAYGVASEVVGWLLPPVELSESETPNPAYTLWSDPKLRSDTGLLILVVALALLLIGVVRFLMRAASDLREPSRPWPAQTITDAIVSAARFASPLIGLIWIAALWRAIQVDFADYTIKAEGGFTDFLLTTLGATAAAILAGLLWQFRDYRKRIATVAGSAALLLFPVIVWVWTAVWLVVKPDYTDHILPALGFVAVAVSAGLLWHFLEDQNRRAALWALAIGLLIAQLRFNATRPPGSIFESNGAVPFFMPFIPFALGLAVAQIARSALHTRQIALMAWRLGLVAWLTALIGFLVKFMGFYDYQNSFVFGVASVLDAPIQFAHALDHLYYNVAPRAVASERNIADMERWKAGLKALAGLAAWVAMYATLWRQHAREAAPSLIARLRGIDLSLQQRRYALAFVLVLPAVALRTFTTFYPFAQSVILSLQRYNPSLPPRAYVGFRNFEKLSTDLRVRESLEFTLIFVFVSTFFQMALGLAIAHLLNANFRLRGIARTISLIPWAVPMVVAAIGFRWMFDDQFGMVPDLLHRTLGYEGKWLVDFQNARIAVMFVSVWKSTPFAALLLLAGLQGINEDLYEAARVDGANWLDSLRFITVPMLLPIIVTISMFLLIWQLAAFDLPFAMTGGGPGFSTTVVAQKIYLEINSLNYSFAAAVSIFLVIVVTLIGGVGVYALRRVEVQA